MAPLSWGLCPPPPTPHLVPLLSWGLCPPPGAPALLGPVPPHPALDVGEGWSDGGGGGQACGVMALQRVQTSDRDAAHLEHKIQNTTATSSQRRRVEAKNPALLSSRDGYLLELTGWTQGSQAS